MGIRANMYTCPHRLHPRALPVLDAMTQIAGMNASRFAIDVLKRRVTAETILGAADVLVARRRWHRCKGVEARHCKLRIGGAFAEQPRKVAQRSE